MKQFLTIILVLALFGCESPQQSSAEISAVKERESKDKQRVVLESEALGILRREGIGTRFIIKPLGPDKSKTVDFLLGSDNGITITQSGKDFIGISEGGITVVGNQMKFPAADGAIHRFNGRVAFQAIPLGIKEQGAFVSEGDELNRLTFCIIGDAYVYLRGKGTVILADGKEVPLGQ